MSMCRKQHCLKVAGKPAEGSMPGHTHTAVQLPALQIVKKLVSLFQFVLQCCSVILQVGLGKVNPPWHSFTPVSERRALSL